MTDHDTALRVLGRGLEQLGTLVDSTGDRLDDPTPCAGWTVRDLVDHVVHGQASFARAVRGEEVDWSGPAPREPDPATAFGRNAADLLAAWGDGEESQPGPDWQTAEVAVHTWDLATALGRPLAELDPEVAERGLAFMQASLKPEMRGTTFGPEQPAPEGADAYQRIAAFAGRPVRGSRA